MAMSSSSSSPSSNPSSTSSGMSISTSSDVDGGKGVGITLVTGDEGAESAVSSGIAEDVGASVSSPGCGEGRGGGDGARISRWISEEIRSSSIASMAVNCDCVDSSCVFICCCSR